MKHAKKILCAVLSLVLVLGIVVTASITTTLASAQTGWNESSTVVLRSTNNAWDEATLIWDHFRDVGDQRNGFRQQNQRANSATVDTLNGPTAWVDWDVTLNGETIPVHPDPVVANRDNTSALRVWRVSTATLERLEVRPGYDTSLGFGDLQVVLTVVALRATSTNGDAVREAPFIDRNTDFGTSNSVTIDTDVVLIRASEGFTTTLMNVSGLQEAIEEAEAILAQNEGLFQRHHDDYVAELRRALTDARHALTMTDTDSGPYLVSTATATLRALVDDASNNHFFLHDLFSPIANGAWGIVDFASMLLQLVAPLFGLITGILELVRVVRP
ncbi:MAG: hypothetical protein FWB76_08375 [Oscillospiraceae bacterium]|nr:hypothetical protein [Oscillospiraceae bacterium]